MSFQASSSEDLDGGPTSWFDADDDEKKDNDNQQSSIELWVQNFPKIELHVHLDGSFNTTELWEHLQKNPHMIHCIPIELKLPWDTNPDTPPVKLRELVSACTTSLDYTHLCTCRRRYRKIRHVEERKNNKYLHKKVQGSLEDMLLCFQFFLPLVYNNYDLLEHLAYDFVKRQKEQNIIYTEVRYSPHMLAKDPRMAHQSITKGLRRGCIDAAAAATAPNDNMLIVNQILCGIDFQPDWSNDVIDMAYEFRNDFPCAVVGVDVAAGETHFAPDSPFHNAQFNMCRKAKKLGIPVTIHAGETPNSTQNVRAAILDYGAKRIGHGYQISNNDDIIELAKSKNINFETCLTSSIVCGSVLLNFVSFIERRKEKSWRNEFSFFYRYSYNLPLIF
ncbi:MAG: adenosine deaminase [Bacillariaceae sp.]|jgi:adenosine deaminase